MRQAANPLNLTASALTPGAHRKGDGRGARSAAELRGLAALPHPAPDGVPARPL